MKKNKINALKVTFVCPLLMLSQLVFAQQNATSRQYVTSFGNVQIDSVKSESNLSGYSLVTMPLSVISENQRSLLPVNSSGELPNYIIFQFKEGNCKNLAEKSPEFFCEGAIDVVHLYYEHTPHPVDLPAVVGRIDIFHVNETGANGERSYLSGRFMFAIPTHTGLFEGSFGEIPYYNVY